MMERRKNYVFVPELPFRTNVRVKIRMGPQVRQDVTAGRAVLKSSCSGNCFTGLRDLVMIYVLSFKIPFLKFISHS